MTQMHLKKMHGLFVCLVILIPSEDIFFSSSTSYEKDLLLLSYKLNKALKNDKLQIKIQITGGLNRNK